MKILLPLSQVFEIRILELSRYRELIEVVLLSSISFLIPVFIGHPQILVGIVVNALIVRTALTMRSWKNFPTILLPSLGAITRGIVFGPSTIYLFYLIPFIWLGNAILSYCIKLFSRRSSVNAIIISSSLKTLAIFLPTLLLVRLSILPELFIKTMSITQFITAVSGGTIAVLLTKQEMRFKK